MKPSSAIAKGKLLEEFVVQQIIDSGLDPKARRSSGSGSGNRDKADIVTIMQVLGRNAGIECKNQATTHIPEWWRQTTKLDTLGMEPILAFKLYGEPLEETKVVIYLDTLLELIKRSQGVTFTPQQPENRALAYALSKLNYAIKDVLKNLD